MYKIIFYVAICMTIASAHQFGYANGNSDQTSALSRLINDSETAIDVALDYTGFDKSNGFSKSKQAVAELKSIGISNIPFIRELDNDDKVWHIQFKDIPIGQQTTKSRMRDFDVIIDRASGKLLMIYSISDNEGSSDTLPQPSKEAAEEFFNERKYQYKQLPDSLCRLTFWEALQKVRIANPATSKIIKCYYWEFDEEEHPYCWLIIQRGIENPIPSSHGGQPIWLENFMMSCIDAMSGKPIFATNAPFDKEDIVKRRQSEVK